MNFFKSFFSSSSENEEGAQAEAERKKFEIFKYDGIRARQIGKIGYAIRCFNEALNIQEDIETMEQLVGAYAQADKYEEALEVATRMIAIQPSGINILLTRANLYFIAGNYQATVDDCEAVIGLDGKNPAAYFLMGKAKKAAADVIGAITALTQALRFNDKLIEAYLLRAEILLQTKEYKEGLKDAEKAVELAPEEENGYLLRARLHEAEGNADKAEEDFQYVIDLNPFNEQAYLFLGKLYIARGRAEEAIELFGEALEQKPDFAEAYSERGRAKFETGDKDGALEDMKKALELNPEGEEARCLEGKYSNFEDMYANRVL